MSIHAELKRQLKDATTKIFPSDEISPLALQGIAEEAINEIERLNLVVAQEENKRLNENIEHLLQIKQLHEKIVLLQEQKAILTTELDYERR